MVGCHGHSRNPCDLELQSACPLVSIVSRSKGFWRYDRTRDLFLSNTVRAHRKLREADVEADLQVYEGLSHAQYLSSPTAPIAKEVFGEITRFFDAHLAH